MSLVEEFKALTEREGYTSYPNHEYVAKEIEAKQVSYEIIDTTRWGVVVAYVYRRDDEYVQVVYEEASGDGEAEYYPTINNVRPYEEVVLNYEVIP